MQSVIATVIEHSAAARARLEGLGERERVAFEARLEKLYTAGRDAWPELEVSDRAFGRAVAAHVRDDGPLAPDELHAADFFLATACAEGVPGAVAALGRDFLSQIPSYVARVCGPSDRDGIDDVTQTIAERLVVSDGERSPKIAEYAGRGPLGGWLRVLSVRMALNLKRGAPRPASTDEAAIVVDGVDPELDHFKWRYRDAFKAAFEAAFDALDDDQRALLRLHASGTHRGEDIAKILGVERSTVMRRLARAREVLFDSTKARLTSDLGVSTREFESIARAVHSQIELTLSRVLAPRPSGIADGVS